MKRFLFILLIILALAKNFCHAQKHADYDMLKQIYLSTNGSEWINNFGWEAGILDPFSNPCDWEGVNCDGANRVYQIVLQNNNLTGTLPSTITLKRLKQLNLMKNAIGGNIPYIDAPLLTQLNLNNNNFTGEIPATIGNFIPQNMMSLTLGYNNLSGCFPASVRQISHFNTYRNYLLPSLGDLTVSNGSGIGEKCNDGITGNGQDVINPDCSCGDYKPCATVNTSKTIYTCNGEQTNYKGSTYFSGSYSVTIDGPCDTIVALTVIDLPTVIADAGADRGICSNTSITIGTDPLSPHELETYTYMWSNGVNTPKQTVAPDVTTSYSLTVANNLGCPDSDQITITVNDKIDSLVVGEVCPGKSYSFKNELFEVGENNILINSSVGCDTLFNLKITEKPAVDLLPKISVSCDDNNAILLASLISNEAPNGTWRIGIVPIISNAFDSILGVFIPYGQVAGDYDFIYSQPNNSFCGEQDILVTISVTTCDAEGACNYSTNGDKLTIDPGPNSLNVLNNDELGNLAEFALSVISFDSNLLENVSIDATGFLFFTLLDSLKNPTQIEYLIYSEQCGTSVSGYLILNGNKLSKVVLSNVLTLDGDGQNDVLKFSDEDVINDSELWIYNRWGQRIFHTKNYKNDWDAKGFPGGIYYYIFKKDGIITKKSLTIFR